jgi:hypothetical protein
MDDRVEQAQVRERTTNVGLASSIESWPARSGAFSMKPAGSRVRTTAFAPSPRRSFARVKNLNSQDPKKPVPPVISEPTNEARNPAHRRPRVARSERSSIYRGVSSPPARTRADMAPSATSARPTKRADILTDPNADTSLKHAGSSAARARVPIGQLRSRRGPAQ